MVRVALAKNKVGGENREIWRMAYELYFNVGKEGFLEGMKFAQDLKKKRKWVLQILRRKGF